VRQSFAIRFREDLARAPPSSSFVFISVHSWLRSLLAFLGEDLGQWNGGGNELLSASRPAIRVTALMKESLQLALQPSVVKRALKYALIVGLVLITINHGDAILHGHVSRAQVIQMALTALVPYVVSTLSSVGALRERQEKLERQNPSPAQEKA